MRKLALVLVVILALAFSTGRVAGIGGIRVVPVSPPGSVGTADSGAVEVLIEAPGAYTISLNFSIHVVRNMPALNISALFILNHTDPSTLASAPTMTETGMGSPVAGTAGTLLAVSGPFSDTHWAYDTGIPSGIGPDCVFPDGCPAPGLPATSYYQYDYVWPGILEVTNGGSLKAWKLIDVSFTVPDGSVSEESPAQFIVVGAGPSAECEDDGYEDGLWDHGGLGDDDCNTFEANFHRPYATPWSKATNIMVIPEFQIGTLMAVALPLLALAGYMRLRGSRSLGLTP